MIDTETAQLREELGQIVRSAIVRAVSAQVDPVLSFKIGHRIAEKDAAVAEAVDKILQALASPPVAGEREAATDGDREDWSDAAADEWAGAHYDNLSPSQQRQWHVFRAGYLHAAGEVNAMELALLANADQMLADFREGDPGKNIQTLVPTPEWKAITKAANRRGVSLSLFLRIAARQHLVWLENYRSEYDIAATLPDPQAAAQGEESK